MAKKDEIYIYDLSILSDSLVSLGKAMTLLSIYFQKCDEYNRIDVSKSTLVQVLKVSPHTVSNWLRKLVRAGAIKYKYSGSARLNPDLYFRGTSEELALARAEWNNFKGEMTG